MKLLAGNSNRPLCEAIGQYLRAPFTKAVAPADRRRLASSTASLTAAHGGTRSRKASW
jgi:hypothetical protein